MLNLQMKSKKLVIYGIGETADIAYEYFTHDSVYEIVAFTVEDEYCIGLDYFKDLPLIPFSRLRDCHDPSIYEVFVAISYTKLNRIREKYFDLIKHMGYKCASYISSRAFVWHNACVGENSMIFENNVIQHKVSIGNGVILWSGNHIGHQTIIEDFAYLSSHVVISGFCKIGKNSFIGVNSTFNDSVSIGKDVIVGSGSLVVKSFPDGVLLTGSPAKISTKTSYEAFNVLFEDI
jgi:sugar O-acyltransferase (sialic acid O-acetyltransferase NeuD family)